jgi:oligoendopeptidase F
MAAQNSNELDFGKLPPYQPRKFVPEEVDLTNAEAVEALYNQFCERQINSSKQLETFLLDRSELDAALGQYESVLYIRMTCQTDDQDRAEAYKKFVETIIPAVKPLADKLDRKYVDAAKSFGLDKKRYEVYDRNVRADVELFREENVELQTQEELLSQKYQTLCGAMTVRFQGSERTMPEMRKFLYEPDRDLRRSAWLATADRRLQDKDELDRIFDRMLSVRTQIATNTDCDNYCDYRFRQLHRFDYTPDDCKNYYSAVQNLVVPVLKRIYERRAKEMNLAKLRPWDIKCDPKGRDALKPFETLDEYIRGIKQIFNRIDPEFSEQFQEMIDLNLLELASRKGKALSGYQEDLWEARKPFIFWSAVGINDDLGVLLHEGGHAFHSLAGADLALYDYRHAPIEFCEVASMSMELFALPHLDIFYNEQDAERSVRMQFEFILFILTYVAAIDAFQHWIYENPGHDMSERAEQWLKLHQHCDGQFEDWSGLERQRQFHWHRILHIFQFPFYMIEYGIAQLGALGLWLQFKNDKSAAISNYRKALSLGGSRPLPELFAAAGLKFDFSEETIAPLMEVVVKELGL